MGGGWWGRGVGEVVSGTGPRTEKNKGSRIADIKISFCRITLLKGAVS